MSTTVLSPEQIAQLSLQQRLALIEVLWDSLASTDVPVADAHVPELDRRLETYDADVARAELWETVRARMERKRR